MGDTWNFPFHFTPLYPSRLKLFFEFPTISVICLNGVARGGGSCPRAPPGGGRQNPVKELLFLFMEKFLKIWENKMKSTHFLVDYILDFKLILAINHRAALSLFQR